MASIKRIAKQFKKLKTNPPIQCQASQISASDMYKWQITFSGPSGTPYEGGIFKVRLVFPQNFPFKAPDMKMVTKVYHPNIKNATGEVCLGILREWSARYDVSAIMLSLSDLMRTPHTEKPLEPQIAEIYENNKERYDQTAGEWTKKFAKP